MFILSVAYVGVGDEIPLKISFIGPFEEGWWAITHLIGIHLSIGIKFYN